MRRPALRMSFFAAALLAAAATGAVPAAAQTYPDEDVYSDALPEQHEIERSADALHRVLDALMDVRIGPLVEAVDPDARHGRYRRDETLGDMARRDDPYVDERLHRSVDGV